MIDKPRLIERAFPLKQASLDSVHEKNLRHGHISTLHIWPVNEKRSIEVKGRSYWRRRSLGKRVGQGVQPTG